jgi:hypothetical protein
MSDAPRLLSPQKRRIFTIDMDDDASITTGAQLSTIFGWTRYRGPAQADTRGWIIVDTDPAINPTWAVPRRVRGQEAPPTTNPAEA